MQTFQTYTELVGEKKTPDKWRYVQKKLVDARFVSGVDNYKLENMISDLKKMYKGTHSAQQIADAIMACCKQREKKISSELFLLFVITKLS